jgi:hypothetical protein
MQALNPSSFSFPDSVASNPPDQAKDATQSAVRSAKDTAKHLALGATHNKANSVALKADSKAKSAAKDADQGAKSAFGLPSNPLAGLGDKIQGGAGGEQQVEGDLSDVVSDVTGSSPVGGGKNAPGQAADKVQGKAQQVRIVVPATSQWSKKNLREGHPICFLERVVITIHLQRWVRFYVITGEST